MVELITIEQSNLTWLLGTAPIDPKSVSWLATDHCAEQYPRSFG
jgi:hypothetical protein